MLTKYLYKEKKQFYKEKIFHNIFLTVKYKKRINIISTYMKIRSKSLSYINTICYSAMLVNCMELDKNKDFSDNKIKNHIKINMIEKDNTINNLKEKNIKNVLVVSTKSSESIENVILKAKETLFGFNKNIEYKFYIVHEIYQCKKPSNITFENYIFTSDSGYPQELNRIVTEVSKWGTSFDYNIKTMNYFF